MAVSRDEVARMSVPERLDLIETIWSTLTWSTLTDDAADIPIPVATRLVLDRRVAEYRRDPSDTESWSELKAKLERPE